VLAAARARAAEVGVAPIGSGGGAALRLLASIIEARSVVEVGTGTGVSGLWLLRGMRADGVLTSVDLEAEHQRLARKTLTEAGIDARRFRLISGAAMDVLPRLTDGHYDLVFLDGDKAEYDDYLADPAQRDNDTVTIRELGKSLRDDERWLPVLLPVGDGLLVAKKVG
jgi:predicted O-methyltransferase YrrM